MRPNRQVSDWGEHGYGELQIYIVRQNGAFYNVATVDQTTVSAHPPLPAGAAGPMGAGAGQTGRRSARGHRTETRALDFRKDVFPVSE